MTTARLQFTLIRRFLATVLTPLIVFVYCAAFIGLILGIEWLVDQTDGP